MQGIVAWFVVPYNIFHIFWRHDFKCTYVQAQSSLSLVPKNNPTEVKFCLTQNF